MANLMARRASPPDVLTAAERRLREVFEADYARLVNASQAVVGDGSEAEEIVQEAFARSYVAWNERGVPSEPAAYVRVAVINLSRTGLRRKLLAQARRPEPMEHGNDPEQAMIDGAEHRLLVAAVASLPQRQRECIALRYVLDLSVIKTAGALGISEGSVKTHTHRALHALETHLDSEHP